MTEGPVLERGSGEAPASFALPMEVLGSKLYVSVDVGGKSRRFVLDTGSPSMIDKTLAEALGLPVVGTQAGTDAHGQVLHNDVVQADLGLGGIRFRDVPLVTADFSASEALKTFIGDGVIGSELLPLGAWQFDLRDSALRFSTDPAELPNSEGASRLDLYDYGYPHAPILDVRYAETAKSKALFDIGSPAYFTLSPEDWAGAETAGGIGKTLTGFGSAGASLGGQAPDAEQKQALLEALHIGSLHLGPVVSMRRERAPSLIGAHLLEHFIVTLNAGSGEAWFQPYAPGPYAQPTFGCSFAFGERISIALVWNTSPAAEAGLKAGTVLDSINGMPAEGTEAGFRMAVAALSGDSLSLVWEGGSALLTRKSRLLTN